MKDPPAMEEEQVISVVRKNFVESTKSLFLDEKTADFWFLFGCGVNQVRIPVHKVILAKDSEVFNAMFYGEMKEENNEVEIVDATTDEFTEFAQFFYADKITITQKNLPKLMYLATKYLVDDLLKVCDEFIIEHLPLEEILSGCDLAVLYDRFALKAKLSVRISENVKEFFTTNAFYECSQDTLKSVLSIDQLICDPKVVFDACMAWARNARKGCDDDLSEMDGIKKQLGECLYHIPFYLMSSEQITQIVNDYQELFDRSEIVELMNMMTLTGRMNNVKKFKYNDDFVTYNETNWRLWWRLGGTSDSRRWIKRQEHTYLSYRNTNVLKAIQPFYIWHIGVEHKQILSGTMKIVRRATAESHEIILLKQPISITCRRNLLFSSMPTIKFAKPIVLEPFKAHKIHFDFDDSWSEKSFYTIKTTSNMTDFMPVLCYGALTKSA